MKKLFIDDRWEGYGGIGTFSEGINNILKLESANFKGKAVTSLDTLKTSIRLCKKNQGVYFFPGYIPPLFSANPYVFTIHDLNHLDRPENSSIFKKLFYKYVIKRGCKKAKYIFTVSEFSKKRIISWSGVDERKVINVGNGVSKNFSVIGIKKDFGFKYFLTVSNRKSHKNEINTLKAFKAANLDEEIKIVFTGNPSEELKAIITDLNLNKRVIFTGYIKTDELPSLYRGSLGLIFVSLYEGFGLPVIEAMASGIPVVTSSTTSLGEISGDAAILVDPENIEEISAGIRSILYNERERENLIRLGLEQSKKYSWEQVSDKVSNALKSIY